MILSKQQNDIVDAPLKPLCVIACAGSGKTITSVHRLNKIATFNKETNLKEWVALLSFSNVATDTFRETYHQLQENKLSISNTERILIETFDSFITNVILKSHAASIMGCECSPFLLSGQEDFLKNNYYKFLYELNGKIIPLDPQKVNDIFIDIDGNNKIIFKFRLNSGMHALIKNGNEIIKHLGTLGAYTHDFGRYWALKVLKNNPALLRAISKKFAHIIIDEAQDIGILHKYLIQSLIKAGSIISLIGDPSQAIYEFAGADGNYLRQYNKRSDVLSYELTSNYRSVTKINNVSSVLSMTDITSIVNDCQPSYGAFFIKYDPQNAINLKEVFLQKITQSGIDITDSAILCRSNDLVNNLSLKSTKFGQGKTKLFVMATIKRDLRKDYASAFDLVVKALIGLLVDPPNDIYKKIIEANRFTDFYELKKILWIFIRNKESGLPSSSLNTNTDWLAKLRNNVGNILIKCEQMGMKSISNINSILSKRELCDSPLSSYDNSISIADKIRVDTVHQSKGESIGAVLYVATNEHINAMLAGVNTELGRIGYVALTRARKLFILAVPHRKIADFRTRLNECGLIELP